MNKCLIIILMTVIISGGAFAQHCNDNTIIENQTEQYIDLENGAVVDTKTGLMWQTCSVGQQYQNGDCVGDGTAFNWLEAFEQADLSVQSGFTDWRLPNVKELASLLDHHCVSPAINLSIFPSALSGYFWSATLVATNSRIWLVNFDQEGSSFSDEKTTTNYVRLVRHF